MLLLLKEVLWLHLGSALTQRNSNVAHEKLQGEEELH